MLEARHRISALAGLCLLVCSGSCSSNETTKVADNSGADASNTEAAGAANGGSGGAGGADAGVADDASGAGGLDTTVANGGGAEAGSGGAVGSVGLGSDGYGIEATLTLPPDAPGTNLYQENLAANSTDGVTMVTASRPVFGHDEIISLSIANMGQTGTFACGGDDGSVVTYQLGIPPHELTDCSITLTKAGTETGAVVEGTFSATLPAMGSYPNGTRELDITEGSFRFKLD